MNESFDRLKELLKRLPGLGGKSAEKIALHLTLERPPEGEELLRALKSALEDVGACPECGGLSERGKICGICSNPSRNSKLLCVVERSSDIPSIEKSGAWRGKYHVLGGKLSPLRKIGPDKLNLEKLAKRAETDGVEEILLALSNDIEAEATCHYIQENIIADKRIKLTRIGFGLPSGSQLGYADSGTIKSALDSRKNF